MIQNNWAHLPENMHRLRRSNYKETKELNFKVTRTSVCIFVREDQNYNKINISLHYIFVQTELETKASKGLYRAPLADCKQFIKRLDSTLKYLYNPKSEFLILQWHKYRLSHRKQSEKNNWTHY
jgi:hypothetical protein